jgi:hypothetical protein
VKSRNAMERAEGVASGGERDERAPRRCSEEPLCSANEAGGERANGRELSALQFFQPMGAHALSCPIVLLSCANKMRE